MRMLNKVLNFLIDPTGILRKQEWLKEIIGWNKQQILIPSGVSISKLVRKFCILLFVLPLNYILFVHLPIFIIQKIYFSLFPMSQSILIN